MWSIIRVVPFICVRFYYYLNKIYSYKINVMTYENTLVSYDAHS